MPLSVTQIPAGLHLTLTTLIRFYSLTNAPIFQRTRSRCYRRGWRSWQSVSFPLYCHCRLSVEWYFTFSYSLLYGSRGANVVVNDFNKEAAQKVVDEINAGAPYPVPFVLRASTAFDGPKQMQVASEEPL